MSNNPPEARKNVVAAQEKIERLYNEIGEHVAGLRNTDFWAYRTIAEWHEEIASALDCLEEAKMDLEGEE